MILKPLSLLLAIFLLISLSACDDQVREDRTHRHSTIHDDYYHYNYYPSLRLYYDTRRHVYFYRTRSGWVRSQHLPRRFHLKNHTYRSLKIRQSKPYHRHNKHNSSYNSKHGNKHRRNISVNTEAVTMKMIRS